MPKLEMDVWHGWVEKAFHRLPNTFRRMICIGYIIPRTPTTCLQTHSFVQGLKWSDYFGDNFSFQSDFGIFFNPFMPMAPNIDLVTISTPFGHEHVLKIIYKWNAYKKPTSISKFILVYV